MTFPQRIRRPPETVVIAGFLNLLIKDTSENPDKLIPFTYDMWLKVQKLIEGVEIDE